MSKQVFVKQLLFGTDVVNGIGLRPLSNERVLRISMHQGCIGGEYIGVKVSIVNKNAGVVDSNVFLFNDYLHRQSTTNHTYKATDFKVIEHCGWNWYINTPTKDSVNTMLHDIEAYVKYFS